MAKAPPSKKAPKRSPSKPRRKPGAKAAPRPSWLLRALAAGTLLTLMGGVAGAVTLWWFSRDLPELISLDDYRPLQSSRVWSADGVELAVFAKERRTIVPVDRIHPMMRKAMLAAEDADFYRHEGLDYRGMLRALLVTLKQGGRITQGASTITQQVVKTFLLTPERTYQRKLKEIILARRLEQNLTKDDILTLYLNQIYYGHGRYGIEEASRFFYGKSAADLTVAEAAMLAGLVQSPERLSPVKHPEAAQKRRAYVLDQMVKTGALAPADAERWKAAPLTAEKHIPNGHQLGDGFVEHVRRQLKELVGDDLLYGGGLSIHTTLQADRQEAAEEAVREGLRAIDRRRRFRRPLRKKGKPKAIRASRIVEGRVAGRAKAGAAWEIDMPGGLRGVLPDRRLERYVDPKESPATPPKEWFSPGQIVRVSEVGGAAEGPPSLRPEFGPQAALVSIDPATRRVVALVGGDPFQQDAFNRATQAKRQPGSAFKPIVYAAGLESRQVHPATIIPDAPEVYVLPDRRWTPQNYDHKFRGPIRLREALANSVNMVAIKLLRDVGIPRTVAFAEQIGVQSTLDPVLPLALGASVVRPIELANVYAVFASGGLLDEPRLIDRVLGPTGGVIWQPTAAPKQVLDPAVAYLITDMMTSVVQHGTAQRAKKLGRPAAGKTGTTNGHTDAWFSGFVPDLVTTVWVGFDDNRPLGKGETGSQTALPIWLDYMQAAVTGPPKAFIPPRDGISILRIDADSGKLAPQGLPEEQVVIERFLTGTGPTEYAALPGEQDADSFLLDQFGLGGEDGAPGAATAAAGGAGAATPSTARTQRPTATTATAGRTMDPEDLPKP